MKKNLASRLEKLEKAKKKATPTVMNKPIQILRFPAVEARTGLSRPTLYRRIDDGTFPKPIPLGSHSVGFVESEIEEWLQKQIRARDRSA